MNINKLNIFFGVGLISLVFLPMLFKCKILEDKNDEIKTTKFNRNESSYSSMKDEIIAETLKKSSLIVSSDPQMIIDKKLSIDDKSCLSQQKTTSDNPLTQEIAIELEFIPKVL